MREPGALAQAANAAPPRPHTAATLARESPNRQRHGLEILIVAALIFLIAAGAAIASAAANNNDAESSTPQTAQHVGVVSSTPQGLRIS